MIVIKMYNSSVRKVVTMQHRWLIKFEHNSDGTYWRSYHLCPECIRCTLGIGNVHNSLVMINIWVFTETIQTLMYFSPITMSSTGKSTHVLARCSSVYLSILRLTPLQNFQLNLAKHVRVHTYTPLYTVYTEVSTELTW